MARIDLTMPKMGESVAEATLVKWCKNIGDRVEMDETILEIATDKVDSEVPSPKSGILVEKLFTEEDVVQVGAVFGVLETEIDSSVPSGNIPIQENHFSNNIPQGNHTQESSGLSRIEEMEKPEESEIQSGFLESLPGMKILWSDGPEPKPGNSVQSPIMGLDNSLVNSTIHSSESSFISEPSDVEDRFYSPLVREIAKKEGLSKRDLMQIKGSGLEGRVTKNDILNFIQNREIHQEKTLPETGSLVVSEIPSSPEYLAERTPLEKKENIEIKPMEGDEIIVMDRMRRLISEHMVMSKNVSAHVTSFVEADVTNLVKWREKIKKDFMAREKENITYTPIFIEAVAKVLKNLPLVNVSVQGNSILVHKHINIGMATALPNGNLIVPVIKDADLMSLVGITKKVNDLANRARIGKLQPEDTQGGTFTITNVGTFGNLMGTPIINQPQVAILATGAIVKKPAVMETEFGDVIAIRHKVYLSLSYDHRVVDGALGGTFLRRVADELENYDPNRDY